MIAARIVLAVIAAGALGCVSASVTRCPDGSTCPVGNTCIATDAPPGRYLCARGDQITACADLADGELCTDPRDETVRSRCYDGACLPITCGDGLVDPLEVCSSYVPDGDQQECCCGNGEIDLVRGEVCDDGNFAGHDGCHECQLETPAWLPAARLLQPSARREPRLVYHAASERLLLFGGAAPVGSGVALADVFELSPDGWVQLAPPPSLLFARSEAGMAYDSARGRTLLFGGTGATIYADTWEFDGRSWRKLAVEAAPPPRHAHAMAYDSIRGRIVLFGGRTFGSVVTDLADTWEWDGEAWHEIAVTGPVERRTHGMAFDPVRGVIVMAGGVDGTTALADVWEYDGTTWRAIAVTGPAPQGALTLAFDPQTRSVLGFGQAASDPAASTWRWDGQQWTKLALAAGDAPTPRVRVTMATRGGAVTLFGGCTEPACGTPLADTWEWTGTRWIELVPRADDPPPGLGTAFAYDPFRGVSVAFGSSPTREFDGRSWRAPAVTTEPPLRTGGAMAHDAERRVSVLFGGAGNGLFADTWLWDGETWRDVTPAASPPPRIFPAMAFDASRGRVVMFGGRTTAPGFLLDDTWEWDGTTWTERETSPAPPARVGHVLVYDPIRRVTVLFGGTSGGTVLADTWTWDGMEWREVSSDPELGRTSAGVIWHARRGRVVLVGGNIGSFNVPLDVVHEWDGTRWQGIVMTGSPPQARQQLALFPDADAGLIAIGGGLDDRPLLRWESSFPYEVCRTTIDRDRDDRVACDDDDCLAICRPLSRVGLDAMTPGCGDGTCDPTFEGCRGCDDCTGGPSCASACGDTFCDADESASTCAGDCPL